MALTADYLVQQVKARCQLPASNGKLTDAEILTFADEELLTTVMPIVRRAREEWFIRTEDTTLTSGTSDYRIPARAQSSTIRDVLIIDSSGNAFDLQRVPLEDVDHYTNGAGYWWRDGLAFCITGHHIRLLPTPTNSVDTLRVRYYLRHGELVETTSSRVTITTSLGTFDAENGYVFNATQQNHSAGDVVDFIQAGGQLDTLAINQTVDGTAAGWVAFLSNVEDQAIGDYIVDAGYTPVVQLPRELHPVLMRATCAAVLEAIGDREGFRAMEAKTQQAIEAVETVINDRTEGAPLRVVNWDSPLRHNRNGWR